MPNEQGMSKRQLLREKRQREEQRNRVFSIVAIVLGALAVFAVLVYPNLKPVDVAAVSSFERPNAEFNATGDPNAPITITEYSDFQCPYCARFSKETEEQLVMTYAASGQVRFVYRSFGLFIGPESQASRQRTALVTRTNTGSSTISCSPITPARMWAITPAASCRLLRRRSALT
jgi:protein-disulfide isomerase